MDGRNAQIYKSYVISSISTVIGSENYFYTYEYTNN